MRKIILALLTVGAAFSAFAQDTTPDMLKKKEFFNRPELYDAVSIFADRNANAELIREFEADPSQYAPDQLLPVAVAYLSFSDLENAKALLEKFLAEKPDNMRAIRTLGTINMLTNNPLQAIEYYKKAYDGGDQRAPIFLGSAFIMSQQIEKIADYVDALKKLAPEDLEALNILLIYAYNEKNENLAKEVLATVDPRKAMTGATPDSFSTILRLYVSNRDIWPLAASVIPARAAALMEAWPLANSTYKAILNENPNDILALRGMGLVAYRTGDTMGAAKYVKKAYDLGEKDAATDGLELFLLSQKQYVWDMFKPMLADAKLNPSIRAGLVQFAANSNDNADMFFFGALGEGSEPLYQDKTVLKLLETGVEKYKSDKRAKDVAELVKSASR